MSAGALRTPVLVRRTRGAATRRPGTMRASRYKEERDGYEPRRAAAIELNGVGRDPVEAGTRMTAERQGVATDHQRVVEIQRARILGAMTSVAAERGAANVAVAHVVERAGVSRRTFYELFSDFQDCLLAAIDDALARVRARVLAAYDPAEPWRVRTRSALVALLNFVDEKPAVGRLLVVESLGAGPRALERRRRALELLIAAVDAARTETRGGANAPALAAEAIVGGALALLHTRMIDVGAPPSNGDAPSPGRLVELTNELMSMIVLPYQGGGSARRELERPMPTRGAPASEPWQPLLADPFKAAGMRLTYRTMRVLGVIAAQPGSSNRQVGVAAGISDQGQISKLLGRLERLGLIVNGGEGHLRGEPNAWALTPAGRQVEHGIHVHSEGFKSQGDSQR